MRKNILSLSIAAMIGGLGFAGAASAGVSMPGTATVLANGAAGAGPSTTTLTSPTATAFNVSPDGIGHILLVPYFSTQSGNNTLISLVNTDTVNGKVLKVRARGAANSDDIYDFTLFLSPGDVWVANISQDATTGLSRLDTPDNSCTLPASLKANNPVSGVSNSLFVTNRLPTTTLGAATASTVALTAAQIAEQTREGYIEVLNMANIPPNVGNLAAGAAGAVTNALWTTTKHVNGVAPCSSTTTVATGKTGFSVMQALLTDPTNEANAVAMGFDSPTGGIMGGWTVINTVNGSTSWSGNDTAIAAVVTGNAGFAAANFGVGRLVFSPQTSDPLPTVGINVNTLTNDPLLRNANAVPADEFASVVAPAMYDLPDLSTPYLNNATVFPATTGAGSPGAQAIALTTSLAVQSVTNEFFTTNAVLTGATDWTFSMPTRRYAVGVNYTTNTAVYNSIAAAGLGTQAAPSAFFTASNVSKSGFKLCVDPKAAANKAVVSFNQSEDTAGGTFVISPGALTKPTFCGEAAVLSFNRTVSATSPSAVLGATIAAQGLPTVTTAGLLLTEGWAAINTPGLAGVGLPILGNSFTQYVGLPAAGKSTNYGVTFPHRNTR